MNTDKSKGSVGHGNYFIEDVMKPKCEFFKASDFADLFPACCAMLADRANALLTERGTVVSGGRYCLDGEWSFVSHDRSEATHTALLIDIREIEKADTAEGLLREFVGTFEVTKYGASFYQADLLERARKLLGEK